MRLFVVDSAERGVCSICQEPQQPQDVFVAEPCYHQFHQTCVETLTAHRRRDRDPIPCPLCRQAITNAPNVPRVEEEEEEPYMPDYSEPRRLSVQQRYGRQHGRHYMMLRARQSQATKWFQRNKRQPTRKPSLTRHRDTRRHRHRFLGHTRSHRHRFRHSRRYYGYNSDWNRCWGMRSSYFMEYSAPSQCKPCLQHRNTLNKRARRRQER